MIKERGTLAKTLERFLSMKEVDKPYCCFMDGKLLVGSASKHRTRSGVAYNKLLRLWRYTHKDLYNEEK